MGGAGRACRVSNPRLCPAVPGLSPSGVQFHGRARISGGCRGIIRKVRALPKRMRRRDARDGMFGKHIFIATKTFARVRGFWCGGGRPYAERPSGLRSFEGQQCCAWNRTEDRKEPNGRLLQGVTGGAPEIGKMQGGYDAHSLLRLLRAAVPSKFAARAGAALLLARLPPADGGPPPRLDIAGSGGTGVRGPGGDDRSTRGGSLPSDRDGLGARFGLRSRHTHSVQFFDRFGCRPL